MSRPLVLPFRAPGRHSWRPRAVAVLLALLATVILSAHEIGTTRVAVTFPDDASYRIEVVTDASALLDKLETAEGRRTGVQDPADLQTRILVLLPLFAERLAASFDRVRVDPAVSLEILPAREVGGVPGAALVLTGQRPVSARTFTWAYNWTFASYALTVQTRTGGETTTQWLEGGDTSAPIALDAVQVPLSRPRLLARYVLLGFTHILPKGLDHVLFVLGVFLLSRRIKPILLQVSAFTIAHSITLGLGMYGLVSVAPAVVEPLIALSIAYIAIENLVVSEFRPWRVALVFGFGLLHGLGFAGALRAVGLPRSEFVTALIGFNAGVELGQLAVIGSAFLAVGYWYGNRVWYRRRIVLPASAAIACFGIFWTVQRLHLG